MRTIKFRGKTRDGEWVYGYYLPSIYEDVDIITVLEDFKLTEKNYHVLKETIGQFTGLLDKNGKEIFEGDVVKTKSGWGGIVLWNSRGYFYIKDENYLDDEEPDLSPIGSLLCCERKQLEIIGNIYDNDELIKEK